MAGVNAGKVLVGAPDQSGVSGAILRAPLGTGLPKNATESVDGAFEDGGYVSSDGVTVTPDFSTTGISDWSGAEVRRLLESFTGEVSFSFIQLGENEAKMVFGPNNVVKTAADAQHGEQLTIKIGAASRAPAGEWVFNMKDGNNAIRVCLPNAEPISVPEMPFVANAPIPIGTTLACYPDSDGYSIYIHTDDGVTSA